MTTIKALNSLLDDIQVLEDIAEKKLELIGEARRVLEMKLRKLCDEEKGVSEDIGRNAENTASAVTPVQIELALRDSNVRGLKYRYNLKGTSLAKHIYGVTLDNAGKFLTSQSITGVLLDSAKYQKVKHSTLRGRVQKTLKVMRNQTDSKWPGMYWSSVNRPGGKKGTMFLYRWDNKA